MPGAQTRPEEEHETTRTELVCLHAFFPSSSLFFGQTRLARLLTTASTLPLVPPTASGFDELDMYACVCTLSPSSSLCDGRTDGRAWLGWACCWKPIHQPKNRRAPSSVGPSSQSHVLGVLFATSPQSPFSFSLFKCFSLPNPPCPAFPPVDPPSPILSYLKVRSTYPRVPT